MVVLVTETRTCDDIITTATTILAAASTFSGSQSSGSVDPGSDSLGNSAAKQVESNQGGTIGHGHVTGGNSFVALGSSGAAGVHRVNKCDYSAWFVPVTNTDRDSAGPRELEPGATIYSPYLIGEGVSEKYAMDENVYSGQPVVQLEYKLGENEPNIMYYDLSFIDCGPTSDTTSGPCVFRNGGYLIEVDQGSPWSGQCPHIYCPHEDDNNQLCRSAYYQYDDVETFSCSIENIAYNANMTITFCPDDHKLEPFAADSPMDGEYFDEPNQDGQVHHNIGSSQ